MPLVDVTGGVICYLVAKGIGTLPSFASVAVSEIILLLGNALLVRRT